MANDLQIVPASNVEAQYVEMRVPLYSYGCEKKVKKALSSLRGMYSVKVDYLEQKVIVWGICNKYDVLARIRKKRKEAKFWNPEDNAELEEAAAADDDHETIAAEAGRLLSRSRSFSFRILKKVFLRSHSF